MNAIIILALGLISAGVAGLLHIFVTKKLQSKLASISEDLDSTSLQLKIISEALTKIQKHSVIDQRMTHSVYTETVPEIFKRIDEQIAKSAERQRQSAQKDLEAHEQRRAADIKPRTLGERMREANNLNFPPKK